MKAHSCLHKIPRQELAQQGHSIIKHVQPPSYRHQSRNYCTVCSSNKRTELRFALRLQFLAKERSAVAGHGLMQNLSRRLQHLEAPTRIVMTHDSLTHTLASACTLSRDKAAPGLPPLLRGTPPAASPQRAEVLTRQPCSCGDSALGEVTPLCTPRRRLPG